MEKNMCITLRWIFQELKYSICDISAVSSLFNGDEQTLPAWL